MTKKTDRMIAEAKMDRIDELLDEVDALKGEINTKLDTVEQLQQEVQELIE